MTIEIGGSSGGLLPPTSLQLGTANSSSQATAGTSTYGAATLSSSITSATLTEVLNIAGPGVLTFLTFGVSGVSATAHKIRVTINGVVAYEDLSGGSLVTNTLYCLIGAYSRDHTVGTALMTETPAVFNTLKLEIAGDGTNGVVFAYKRYLT